MAKTKTMTTRVPAETFVKEWAKAHAKGKTAADVGEAVGLSVGSVHGRGRLLRKLGVELPKLERIGGGRPRLDVDALNALLK